MKIKKKIKLQLEEVFLGIGSIWNIVTGAITMFYYSSWLQQNVLIETTGDRGGLFADRYYFESVYLFVIGYGLAFILLGAVNFYLSTKIRKDGVSTKVIIWLCLCALALYLTMDIIGFIFYFATVVTCIFKNMALKTINSQAELDA